MTRAKEGSAAVPEGFEDRDRRVVQSAEAVGSPAREMRLVAVPGEVEVGPGSRRRTWLYNGGFPGEPLRLTEDERLRVVLENRLPEPTTVHWHGVPLPNAMDGVPGVTQPPVAPGETFVYDYLAEPAGFFHCHNLYRLEAGMARVFRYAS